VGNIPVSRKSQTFHLKIFTKSQKQFFNGL
jgi:hypothetical protein